jgi:hypothetical protein
MFPPATPGIPDAQSRRESDGPALVHHDQPASPALARRDVANIPNGVRGVRQRKQTRPNSLRHSAAELWGNHEVTGEHNYSPGGAEPIASPRHIDQRAVGGSRPFGPGRSCPARLYKSITTKKRHKQQIFAGLSQNFHERRRAESMTTPRSLQSFAAPERIRTCDLSLRMHLARATEPMTIRIPRGFI